MKADRIEWVVPKSARVGDSAVFFFRHLDSFVALGCIGTSPEGGIPFGKRPAYRADVADVRAFKNPITRERTMAVFPDWAWLRYPRGWTTASVNGLIDYLARASVSRPTYLLTWSPDSEGDEEDWGKLIAEKNFTGTWRCRSSHVKQGDRLFFLRQGGTRKEARGFFARGAATADWERNQDDRGFIQYRMEEDVLDPNDPRQILSLIDLPQDLPDLPLWTTQCSGVSIPLSVADRLELAWEEHLGRRLPEPEERAALDGAGHYYMTLHRRREQWKRKEKIAQFKREHDGRLYCEVRGCHFDFLKKYGDLGKDYIQVHHINPLATFIGPTEVRLEDLRLVCANCHVMIHQTDPSRTLEGLIPRNR